MRQHYLTAPEADKQAFAMLIEQEDPDLLDWFMAVSTPAHTEMGRMVEKLKSMVFGSTS